MYAIGVISHCTVDGIWVEPGNSISESESFSILCTTLYFSLILLLIVYCIINFIWCLIVMLIWADNSKKKKTKKVLVRSNLVEIGLQRKYSALYLQHNLVTSLFLDVRFHKELNNFSNYWHRETDYSYKHQEIDHVVIY